MDSIKDRLLTRSAKFLIVDSHCIEFVVKSLQKRRHDLREAYNTLGYLIEMIEQGYNFQDDRRPQVIEEIAKIRAVLERELALLS